MNDIKKLIRDIPDFPKKGIVFKDITPLLGDPKGFRRTIEAMAAKLDGKPVKKVVGIESRGFIFGSALAHELSLGFVPARKPGKLPYTTVREAYALEYGTDAIEMHSDAIGPGEKVVLIDDLLATGGTLGACAKLVKNVGGDAVAAIVVVELSFLKGRERLAGLETHALLSY
jgi:adenine phosphoribosyltransferase